MLYPLHNTYRGNPVRFYICNWLSFSYYYGLDPIVLRRHLSKVLPIIILLFSFTIKTYSENFVKYSKIFTHIFLKRAEENMV